MVDRWLATPKRARIAHWSLSRDRRINMQLTNFLPYIVACFCEKKAQIAQVSSDASAVMNIFARKDAACVESG